VNLDLPISRFQRCSKGWMHYVAIALSMALAQATKGVRCGHNALPTHGLLTMKALDLGWNNESWDLMCRILGADVSNV
jgi:hypothetical protein